MKIIVKEINIIEKLKSIRFAKMHGLGNDFMIIDARKIELNIDSYLVKALSNRNLGVGFDQLAVIYEPIATTADCLLKFWNNDGSVSPTCGNASRCIADLLFQEKKINSAVLETDAGLLQCKIKNGLGSVNMGNPKLAWNEIPLAIECDTLHLPLEGDPVATSMGNPHCTFFVKNIDSFDISEFGHSYEKHQLFPNRTNVQIAQIMKNDTIRVKVWERGTGKTLASGSSSCAVAVAAYRRGLTNKTTNIILDGGELQIIWSQEGVWMSGETKKVFEGTLSDDFLLGIERSTG